MPIDLVYRLQVGQLGRNSAMQRQEAIIDDGSYGQRTESITESLIDLNVVRFETLIAKVIKRCHLLSFVISAQKEHILGSV